MRTFKLAGLVALGLLTLHPTIVVAEKTPTDEAVDRYNKRAENADRKVTRQSRKGQRKMKAGGRKMERGAKKAGHKTGEGLEKTGTKLQDKTR